MKNLLDLQQTAELSGILHDGRLTNAPLEWKLTGYDGNYTATVSGGSHEARKAALDTAFDRLGQFSEKFRDAIVAPEAGSSCTLRMTNTELHPELLEGSIYLQYRALPCAHLRREINDRREFIDGCLGGMQAVRGIV